MSALSTSDVWTVGQYITSSDNFDTLTEHWDGSAWSIIPSPNGMSQFNNLLGVSAVSAKDVWAVGNSNVSQQTLIEHWDGAKWSIFPSPSPGASGNTLNSVVAVSATNVWAVGYQYNSNGIQQTLIEQWNGSQWSVVTSPNPGSSINVTGVTKVSATNVWAVGYHDGSNTVQTLIEQWNGKQWSVVTSPNPGSALSMLNGVVDMAGSSAWAVGVYANKGFTSKRLTEHWSGKAWSVVKSPNVVTYRG